MQWGGKDLLHNPESMAPLVEGDIDENEGGPDYDPQVRQRPPFLPIIISGQPGMRIQEPTYAEDNVQGHREVEENDVAWGELSIPDEGLMPGRILLCKEAGRENEHEGIRH